MKKIQLIINLIFNILKSKRVEWNKILEDSLI